MHSVTSRLRRLRAWLLGPSRPHNPHRVSPWAGLERNRDMWTRDGLSRPEGKR